MITGRRISALLLLALWLPAMLHCRLEAAGLQFAGDCCAAESRQEQTHAGAATDCVGDACEIAEGDFTAPAALVLKAPPVDVILLFFAVTPVPAEPYVAPPNGVTETTAAPRELTVPWVLVTRGPVSPRAP